MLCIWREVDAALSLSCPIPQLPPKLLHSAKNTGQSSTPVDRFLLVSLLTQKIDPWWGHHSFVGDLMHLLSAQF